MMYSISSTGGVVGAPAVGFDRRDGGEPPYGRGVGRGPRSVVAGAELEAAAAAAAATAAAGRERVRRFGEHVQSFRHG